jgi:parallel beta-helix repeat protein
VAGNCSESVSMPGREFITIVGLSGARVFGPNDDDAFDILGSRGGILATQDSHVDLVKAIVSGNQGFGISVQQGSNVRLGGATVSNNTGDGVHIQWLSIGNFLSGNTITGNGGASVFCAGRSLALGNLSTLSNVRCGDN